MCATSAPAVPGERETLAWVRMLVPARFVRLLGDACPPALLEAVCTTFFAPRAARGESHTIFGGTQSDVCVLPDVICVGAGSCRCTATLIHPRVLLYAAHCGLAGSFHLGEDANVLPIRFARSMLSPDYGANPDPNDDVAVDWAIAVLDQPLNLPVTPVAYGC